MSSDRYCIRQCTSRVLIYCSSIVLQEYFRSHITIRKRGAVYYSRYFNVGIVMVLVVKGCVREYYLIGR